MKGKVLKLNRFYFPIEILEWRDAVKNIFSQTAVPIDLQYSEDQDPEALESFEWSRPVTGDGKKVSAWDEWCNLPVRDWDDTIRTTRGVVRAPSIILCTEYERVKWHKQKFPTKENIWVRDNFTCCYTGRKLTRDELSVDHIVPRSKGGEDTWLNLVTCDKKINCEKGDKDLKDFRLKLKSKPFIPKNTMAFKLMRPEWSKFVAECS